MKVLIVGAGFAGAVHARLLAEQGIEVHVIDKRDHVGGNCFDFVGETGVRVHRYGPHLFHTSNMKVVEWLSRFTQWSDYQHRVKAKLPDGKLVPLPVNIETVNGVFGLSLSTPEQLQEFLTSRAVATRILPMPSNIFMPQWVRS